MRTLRTLALLLALLPAALGAQAVDLTARGSGPFVVYVDGVETSRHTTEREAIQRVTEALAQDPGAAVHYVHDYAVDARLVGAPSVPTPAPDPDTTTAPPPPQTTTNEPAGMTRILYTDGSDKLFGTGGTAPGWFFGARWLEDRYVEDGVPDGTSPHGTVIEKRLYVGDPAGWNGLAEYNWAQTVGVKRRLYLRAVFKFSANYQICSTNEKPFGYVGGPGGDGADVYIYMDPSGRWGLSNEFNGAGFVVASIPFTMQRGQWITLELDLVAESSPSASDGERRIWINRQLVNSAAGLNWSSGPPGWSQTDLFNYWGGGGCTKNVNDVISIGEIYLSAN